MRAFAKIPGAVIRVSGEDHLDFLQGQGTADLRGPIGFARYCLWLDFRGQIHGDAFVLRLEENSALIVSESTPAGLLMEKFDRHIIADDVELEDLTGNYRLVAIHPEDLEDPQHWPETGLFAAENNIVKFRGRLLGPGTPQLLILGEVFPGNLDLSISHQEARLLRISSGMPSLPVDSDGNSLNPLEARIMSAISFDKGCYLGQEVVSRLHRLDRIPRRLVHFSQPSPGNDEGTILHMESKPVGKLTSVVKSTDKMIAIGWLKSKILDGEVTLDEGIFSVDSLRPT